MIQTLIGKKIEQTQGFLSDGTRIPVTVISVPKTSVLQVKTVEKEGYLAVQIGIGARKKPTKPLLGHSRKANLSLTPSVFKEVKLISEDEVPAVGDSFMPSDVFKTGDLLKVSGTGKGKGFQGGVRRHGFKGGPRTHGQSDRERAPGSIGQTTTPGRVYKGKRMAGHMGTGNVSVTNLAIISVDGERIMVKGLIPGVMNSTVYIEKTGELKTPLEFYEDPEEKAAKEAKNAAVEPEADQVAEPEIEKAEVKAESNDVTEPAAEDKAGATEEVVASSTETEEPVVKSEEAEVKEVKKGDK